MEKNNKPRIHSTPGERGVDDIVLFLDDVFSKAEFVENLNLFEDGDAYGLLNTVTLRLKKYPFYCFVITLQARTAMPEEPDEEPDDPDELVEAR